VASLVNLGRKEAGEDLRLGEGEELSQEDEEEFRRIFDGMENVSISSNKSSS